MKIIRIHFSSLPTINPMLSAAFLLLLVTCLACNYLAPTALPGEVLFQDDFSRTSSGWSRYQAATLLSDYDRGAYRILILAPDTDAWSTPGLDISDVQIEVDATKAGGPDNNYFGKNGERQLLDQDAMLPAQTILTGRATNHIRVDCNGERLSLYANGTLLHEVKANEFSHGDIGLIAGTYASPGTDIVFDNLMAIQP
jgi:hypothetical protein